MSTLAYNEEHIEILKDLEPVRRHPGMYIGRSPEDPKASWQMVKEILDNSVDETIATNSKVFVDIKFLYVNKKKWQCVIKDTGRGIPLGSLKDVFSKLHASGKHMGAYGGTSAGVHGVGVKLVSALAETFIGMSKREGKLASVIMDKGAVVKHSIVDSPKYIGDGTGTIVFFEPDTSILTTADQFLDKSIFGAILDLIEFFDIHKENVSFKVVSDQPISRETILDSSPAELWKKFDEMGSKVLYHPSKLTRIEYVHKKYKLPKTHTWEMLDLNKPIIANNPDSRFGYEISLFLTAKAIKGPQLVASVNMVPITDLSASHIAPLLKAIKTCVVGFIDDKEMAAYFTNIYKLPICGSIITTVKDVAFVGQHKTNFQRNEMAVPYYTSLIKKFNKYPAKHWEKLYSLLYKDLEAHYAKYTNRMMLSRGLRNINLSLKDKGRYYGCMSSDNSITELLITEGNSAGGSVVKVRDPNTQAIFKLRGKPVNLFKKDSYESEIIKDMIRVIGVTPADKTLDNMNFRRLGILVDADPDGKHIAALLIGIFYKINPLILSEGRVFATVPPLFSTTIKGKEKLFLLNYEALIDARIEKLYSQAFELEIYNLKTKKGYKLDKTEFRELCYYIIRVCDAIEMVSDMLAVDPIVLEWMVRCHKYLDPLDMESMRKALKQDKAQYHKDDNCIIFTKGLIDTYIPLHRLKQEIDNAILPTMNMLPWEHFVILATTKCTDLHVREPMTFVQLRNEFAVLDNEIKVQHLKGLGEMTEAALRFTTVDPMTRSQLIINSIGDLEVLHHMLGADTAHRKTMMSV